MKEALQLLLGRGERWERGREGRGGRGEGWEEGKDLGISCRISSASPSLYDIQLCVYTCVVRAVCVYIIEGRLVQLCICITVVTFL